MLSGKEIIRQVELGNIKIDGFDKTKVNPNSYNLHLGKEYCVYQFQRAMRASFVDPNTKQLVQRDLPFLDPRDKQQVEKGEIPDEGMIIMPNTLYLMTTEEYTETNGFVPCIDGRSSVGRLGVQVHVTAGFGDNGFRGKWTLEVATLQPVLVYPGMEICQIYFHELTGDPVLTYDGKYQDQKTVNASKMNLDDNVGEVSDIGKMILNK
jgi:dCTP deaminase